MTPRSRAAKTHSWSHGPGVGVQGAAAPPLVPHIRRPPFLPPAPSMGGGDQRPPRRSPQDEVALSPALPEDREPPPLVSGPGGGATAGPGVL